MNTGHESLLNKKLLRFLHHYYKGFAIITSSIFLCIGVITKELKQLHDNVRCVYEITKIEPNQYICIRKPHSEIKINLWHKLGKHYISRLSPTYILRCCQSKDKELSYWLAYLISLQRDWPDYMYSSISQGLNLKISVYLALCYGVNLKFFKKPPSLYNKKVNLIEELTELISHLPIQPTQPCIAYFHNYATKLKIEALSLDDRAAFFGCESLSEELVQNNMKTIKDAIVVYLLHALLGHSQIPEHNISLCSGDSMLIFRQIFDEYSDNKLIINLLLNILCNVSTNQKSHQYFFEAGWISIFASMLRSTDLHVQLLSSRILHNMNDESTAYSDCVYLYHPHFLSRLDRKADIVFIHGIHGGPTKTWRQIVDFNDISQKITKCWPKDWLAKDIPDLRLLAVNYETCLSGWTLFCPVDSSRLSLERQADVLLQRLIEVGLGSRPIIWVGHSMGGLLIKEMLTRMADAEDSDEDCILKMTRGIIFYSVPHRGSTLAQFNKMVSYFLDPSSQVKQLAFGSSQLLALHTNFINLVQKYKIKMLSFSEGQTTNLPFNIKTTIVDNTSSEMEEGEMILVSEADHISICKPASHKSLSYSKTLLFIRNCLNL